MSAPQGLSSSLFSGGRSVGGRTSPLCALADGLLIGLERFLRGRLGLPQRLVSSFG